mgnify:CR=1 FL=1
MYSFPIRKPALGISKSGSLILMEKNNHGVMYEFSFVCPSVADTKFVAYVYFIIFVGSMYSESIQSN